MNGPGRSGDGRPDTEADDTLPQGSGGQPTNRAAVTRQITESFATVFLDFRDAA